MSSATGPVSSAWLRSRTVMSMANISAARDETTDRYELNASIQNGIAQHPNRWTVLSHKICQNEIVIRLDDTLSGGPLM
jgi:hypothetical protein